MKIWNSFRFFFALLFGTYWFQPKKKVSTIDSIIDCIVFTHMSCPFIHSIERFFFGCCCKNLLSILMNHIEFGFVSDHFLVGSTKKIWNVKVCIYLFKWISFLWWYIYNVSGDTYTHVNGHQPYVNFEKKWRKNVFLHLTQIGHGIKSLWW